MKDKCIVVLSGGQDSTTCAAIAQTEYKEVHAITFDYSQRHYAELESAAKVAEALNLASHDFVWVKGVLQSTSPLLSENEVQTYQNPDDMPEGIASTFVPCRNTFFLTIAANRAIALGCNTIYTGVCETDYSGYPDCRRSFIDALQQTLSLGNWGTTGNLEIKTPLMWLTKAQTVLKAKEILGDRFDKIMALTHTCYQGVEGGCGVCAACLLRDKGFREAGVRDPLWNIRHAHSSS
jgi:7-cyano-7-deazaguanine synthase